MILKFSDRQTTDSYAENLSNPKMKLREKTKFKIIEEMAMEELMIMAQPNKDGLYNLFSIAFTV